MIEKRKRTRVEFSTQVIIETTQTHIKSEAHSKDISLNGMLISAPETLPLGTKCQIRIMLPGSTDMSIDIDGEVSRHSPAGIGIRFIAMDPDSFSHLKNIAMYNASDPDAIEDEILNVPLKSD